MKGDRSIERQAPVSPVGLGLVRIAAAYRDAYPDEIAEAIAQNRRPIDDVGALYPFIEVVGA